MRTAPITTYSPTNFHSMHSEPSCCKKIQFCFTRFKANFNQSSIGRLYDKVVVLSPLISNVFICISSVINSQFFTKLANLLWSGKDLIDNGWKRFEWLFKAIKSAKVFAATVFPLAIFCVTKAAYDMVTTNEKMDAFLNLLSSLGWFGDSAANFVMGLESLGLLAAEHVNLAFTFSVIGAFLSSATFVLNAKHLYEGKKILAQMSVLESRPNDVLELLKQRSDCELNRYFGLLGQDIREHIQEDNLKVLKGRIESGNWSCKLRMVAAAITCVSMPIILFTACFTLGYGLLAVGSMFAIVGFFSEYEENTKLKVALNI